jgi:hypothetical protein
MSVLEVLEYLHENLRRAAVDLCECVSLFLQGTELCL